MPRPRKVVPELPEVDDAAFVADPEPAAARPRARRAPAKAAGNRGRVPARTKTGRIMSKAQMVDKVRAEVGMWLDLAAAGWEIRDPICAASATQERIDTLADSLTSMIARNDGLLEMASKTGIIADIVKTLTVGLAIGREVWRAHGPSGVGHQSAKEFQGDYAAQYPAASIAR